MEQDKDPCGSNSPVDSRTAHKTCFITRHNTVLPAYLHSLMEEFPTANIRELPSPAALQARVVVAFAPTEQDYGLTVKAIRRQPGLLLKPVLMICEESSERWKTCIDSEIVMPPSPSAVRDTIHRLQDIGRRVNRFRPLENHTRACRLRELLLLRYLASRPGASVAPVSNIHCSEGYQYPLADAVAKHTATSGHQLLQALHEAGLLRGRVVDRVRICPGCGDFRLNARRVCPHCATLVSADDPPPHQFDCSYTGRQSEFESADGLDCPECNQKPQPSVDYERHSSSFCCQNCDEWFEAPQVQFACLNCGETIPADGVETRLFREYELTRAGKLTAEAGAYPETHVADLLRNDPGLYRPDAFKQLYRLEIARCQRYDVPATLALLSLENLSALVGETSGERTRRLTSDLKELLGDTFRETDLLGDVSRDRVLVIFTHTPPRQARRALQRLHRKMRKLVGRPVSIEMDLFDLREEAPALEQFRSQQQ